MRSHAIALLLAFIAPGLVMAHEEATVPATADAERIIAFPDTAEYLTLVADLHTHSVFSDGHVWPRTRVEEALRDGLDALAITEHLEYQPHRADLINSDRNRAYDIAALSAQGQDLIVIRGSEITREMPVGHINAVFITDANALFSEPAEAKGIVDADAYDTLVSGWPAENALEAANAQGAFLFWNHPDWTAQAPDGITRPTPFHLEAIANQQLHGIEVANTYGYSEEAFQVALDQDLALIGVSDVHELIDWDYEPYKGGHRPVTLVFAKERSSSGIRDALFARRTVVWYKNLLLGRQEHLLPLLQASLRAVDAKYVAETLTVQFTLVNDSDARLLLDNRSEFTFLDSGDLIEVLPHGSIELVVKPRAQVDSIALEFTVLNALIAPKQAVTITLQLPVSPAEKSPGE
jgi:3',5'-nucleoside bisphosphate phosphatase